MARLCSAAVPAWGAEVVSSNIVGYEKVILNVGYNMVGVQFRQVGGGNLDLSTAGVLEDSFAGFDDEGAFANELQVWNGVNGYTVYGWSGTSGTDVLEDPTLDNQWVDLDLAAITEEAKAGSGFWIKAATAGDITISGEVPTDATTSQDLTSGFNVVANPYPGAVPVSKFGTLDATFEGFDEEGTFATELQVWNGVNGYTVYGWSGTSGTDVLEDPSVDGKWVDLDLAVPDDTVTIPFGTAVWIKTPHAGTITFTSPVAE